MVFLKIPKPFKTLVTLPTTSLRSTVSGSLVLLASPLVIGLVLISVPEL